MNNKKIIYFILLSLLSTALILAVVILAFNKNKELKVYFLAIGQGDAILISESGNQVLIDSGRNGKLTLEKLGKAMPFWDRKIETVILSHSDADHYGGLNEVLDFYKVENIIKTDTKNEDEEWNNLLSEIQNKNVMDIKSTSGTEIIFPSGARLKIIYPIFNNPNEKDKNKNSIVTRLVFGENEFLFTGDLPKEGEDFLVNSFIDIQSDFLKVGHHGSKTSSSDSFLDKVKLREAIISVGKDNRYGHPHGEVLGRLKSRAVQIWRTDEDGTILYKCKNIKDICRIVR